MKTFQLTLPTPNTLNEHTVIESLGSVVFIGANGSGKTRLGAWIEHGMMEKTHRISAQKSLNMPEASSTSSVERAECMFLYGFPDRRVQNPGNKQAYRWADKPYTHLLNDYQQLMELLFSEEFEQSTRYRQSSVKHNEYSIPPITKLDIVKRIWEETLPYRELIIGGGKIETAIKNSPVEKYNAAGMSDGERVIFYLIGQCLCAPRDGVIIIDEPELHLHRSVQAKLWDEIEAERPDCLFVYLTHDLDFAASRAGAKKIWLKSYDGNSWDWLEVPESDAMPEELLLNVLGSRKPILFVEGEKGSLDHFVYRHLYPEETVIPCGGCSHVIHATQSFAALKHLHIMECRGIVDRDNRSENEFRSLKTQGINVLRVSEVENLFLTEEVLLAVATYLKRDDAIEILTKIKALIFEIFTSQKERLISALVTTEIENQVKDFHSKAQGVKEIKAAFETAFNSENIATNYEIIQNEVENAIAEKDYRKVLEVFDSKGLLLGRVGPFFGMKSKEFIELAKNSWLV